MFRGRRSLFRDEAGVVGPAYAVGILVLVAIAGVGFDYGRMVSLDSELQNAADQAALAGATQLDGKGGACARAANAVADPMNRFVVNHSRISNDGGGSPITFQQNETACDKVGGIRFWQDEDKKDGATDDSNAHFIEVLVDARAVNYALTPLVGAFSSGLMNAAAMAGLGSSICKVPPLMICSPDPTQPFYAAGKRGWGVMVTGHGNTKTDPGGTVSSWAPGDFGFLEVGSGKNSELMEALAFTETAVNCSPIDGTKPSTGNPQGLYDAINTRFDIYDFSGGNGTTLAPCLSGSCPAALNVIKDVVKPDYDTTPMNNKCGFHVKQGWRLPPDDRQFWPNATPVTGVDGLLSYNDTSHSPSIDAMGLPRDLCHYASYGTQCTSDATHKFGDGNWARGDYFAKNHPGGARPANAGSITRYDTYLWELGLNNMPHGTAAGTALQFGRPICSSGTANGIDRRVLTVAIVKNCASLNGGSTAVEVDEWVDMFLVQPVVDIAAGRGNGDVKDSIYMEVIRPASVGNDGGAPAPQTIRRDVPYLVQ